MKLGVLFGGASNEHDISCISAASVLRNLDKTRYEIFAVGITKDGRWFYYPDYSADLIESGAWKEQPSLVPAMLSPDRETHGLILFEDVYFTTIALDCVFPVLHGKFGEDGTVQGLFELAGIPYVGCGVAASANAMDKSLTKIIVDTTGVRQARYYLAYEDDYRNAPERTAKAIAEVVGSFPLFIKPCSSGSSVGAAKAMNETELHEGLLAAFEHDKKVLVEEFIDGYEVECAILGNRELIASAVGQIAPTQQFYTFDAKYNDESSALYIPARITEEQMETVRINARRIYAALGCRGLSRVDFFCERQTGEIIFNELNSLPGFTSISMYPKLHEYGGIGYSELLTRLITLALEQRYG